MSSAASCTFERRLPSRSVCSVRLVAEYPTEPFRGGGTPPEHAQRALDVIRAAGLTGEFGPLGTEFSGDADEVLDTLRDVLAAALDAGESRVTVQMTAQS